MTKAKHERARVPAPIVLTPHMSNDGFISLHKDPEDQIIVTPNQQVYVFERNDGNVKIGVSTAVKLRKRTIETLGGFVATRFFSGGKAIKRIPSRTHGPRQA